MSYVAFGINKVFRPARSALTYRLGIKGEPFPAFSLLDAASAMTCKAPCLGLTIIETTRLLQVQRDGLWAWAV